MEHEFTKEDFAAHGDENELMWINRKQDFFDLVFEM